MEEKEGIKIASLFERVTSQVALLQEKFVSQKEKVRPLRRICFEGNRLMEVSEEEICPLQKIVAQRNGLVEASQKEEVLRYKPGIHTHPEIPFAEKESRMEADPEEVFLQK